MNRSRIPVSVLGILAVAAMPAFGAAAGFTVRENSVIPVFSNDQVSLRDSRVGDRFYVTVDGDRDLPRGTRLVGEVRSRNEARNGRPAYLDLEFTQIVLPNGQRTRIRAVPIAWNDKNMRRGRDGRFEVNTDTRRGETTILGGTAAGLLIGSLIKKPVEGAIIGAVAGVVAAEAGRKASSGEFVIRKGDRLGALVQRDFVVDIDYNDRYAGQDRDDREWRSNDRRDDRRDDRREDRWDDQRDTGDRDEDLRIAYRDRDLRFTERERPFRIGDRVMVPLRRTATQLDLRVDQSRENVFFLEDDENSIRIEQDSREYRLNGRKGTMSGSVIERDGVVYVPVEIFAKLMRDSISVNGTRISREF